MTSRSLLVVNYRSAALTAAAVESARMSSREPLQIVIVDNSCDTREANALEGLGERLIISDRNRGYAGGINLGRPACSGDVIIISNPDVIFGPEAIDRLLEAMRPGVAVTGPAMYWDREYRWLLPPADEHTAWSKLEEVLASRSLIWRRRRDVRRFRERVAHWSLQSPSPAKALSGAVMAVRALSFDGVHGFDERFALYYEESDFLRRMGQSGWAIVFVPGARCRHLFNQSAGQEAASAAAQFAESELRYLEKWNGRFLARVLKRLERPSRSPGQESRLRVAVTRNGRDSGIPSVSVDRDDVIVEASPLSTFDTAAGMFVNRGVIEIPPEVWESYRSEVLYLRTVVRQTGEVLSLAYAVK